MTQEALKLALDALKKCHYYMIDAGLPNQSLLNEVFTASTAIKEALREHAMREVQRLGQEIEQEPVVWMYQDKSTHEVRFQKHMRDFVDHGATYETPLYTTPPQRKPLTDEEIMEKFNKAKGAVWISDFARDIEAAHGIKENT